LWSPCCRRTRCAIRATTTLARLVLGGFLRIHAFFHACGNGWRRLANRYVPALLDAAYTTQSSSTCRRSAASTSNAVFVAHRFPTRPDRSAARMRGREIGTVRRCQRRRNGKREHRDVERDGECCGCCILVHWCHLPAWACAPGVKARTAGLTPLWPRTVRGGAEGSSLQAAYRRAEVVGRNCEKPHRFPGRRIQRQAGGAALARAANLRVAPTAGNFGDLQSLQNSSSDRLAEMHKLIEPPSH
jgi:hypothetical protein